MKLAVVGCGKMGSALVNGWLHAELVQPADVTVKTSCDATANTLQATLGICAMGSLEDAITGADVLLLAVKPYIIPEILPLLAPFVTSSTLVITVAAGIPIKTYVRAFGADVAVVRSMPNTPASTGFGATGLAFGNAVSEAQREMSVQLFEAVGIVEIVPEGLMDAVNGLSGSGPGFVFTIIEALIDGGVLAGLPRATSRRLAAQTVLGSAQLVLESPLHPAQLRDQVTTPAGTTMAGIDVLENRAVRAAIMDAVFAATKKSEELGLRYK